MAVGRGMQVVGKKKDDELIRPDLELKKYLNKPDIKERIESLWADQSEVFINNILTIANESPALLKMDKLEIYKSALVAARLKLPLEKSLGYAYLVPYNDKPQFQLGAKGYIQLALRSGQFKKLTLSALKDGNVLGYDSIKDELKYDLTAPPKSDEITHYVGYFMLHNGFEKYFVMTREEVEMHAKTYSPSYNNPKGLWRKNFNAMALKTVVKQLLSKFAPLTPEMRIAIKTDQAVIKSDITENENVEVDYVDSYDIENIEEAVEITEPLEEAVEHDVASEIFGSKHQEEEQSIDELF